MNKAVPAVALLFVYLEAAYNVPVSVFTCQFINYAEPFNLVNYQVTN